MGSSFSIVNDTKEPVWVYDGVCHKALWGSIEEVLGVIVFGAGIAEAAKATGGTVATSEVDVGTAAGTVAGDASDLCAPPHLMEEEKSRVK